MSIVMQQVNKSYGSRKVLDQVDLVIPQGQTHVLLGSSGSGKSTLLRIIAGLVSPSFGSVWVEGVEMSHRTQRNLVQKLGYVVQEGGLFPHLTSQRNVTLVAELLSWSKQRIQDRLLELCTILSLDSSLLTHYPMELSGGQKQRVALMRALFLDPPILLLDEPLGALDPIVRADLQQEFKEMFSRLRKTVVLVTHDLGEAIFLGDTLTLLREGKIIQQGVFSDFLKFPLDPFVTRFINAQRPIFTLESFI